MRRLMLLSAAAAFAGLAWWHLPAVAQRAPQPAASEAITFEQYRDFRVHDLAQRRTRLAKQLARPTCRQQRRRASSAASRITISWPRCPSKNATSSTASGSTRSTPIMTGSSTPRSARSGARSSAKHTASRRRHAPDRAASNPNGSLKCRGKAVCGRLSKRQNSPAKASERRPSGCLNP
jgi:hypothetical protein